jgi:glycerol-3-phosphate acyltransferase PlsY
MIILLFLLAYLLGSIPTAVWVSKKYYGFDIREVGSGNAGATNAFRVLGTKTGVLVLFVDMLKGAMAVKLAYLSSFAFGSIAFTNLQIGLGLLAVVGHILPSYLFLKNLS